MFVIWCTRQVFTEPKTIVHVGSQDHGLGLSHLVCSLPSPCYTKWNGVWFVLHFLSETIFFIILPEVLPSCIMLGSIPIRMSKGILPWQSSGSDHMAGVQWMELDLYTQDKPSLLGMCICI